VKKRDRHAACSSLADMFRRLSVLALFVLVGCVTNSEEAFAPRLQFDAEIAACHERRQCDLLCMRVFSVTPDAIAGCRITKLQDDGAFVRVDYFSDDGFDFGSGGDDGGDGGGGGYPSDDDGGGYEDPDDDYEDDGGYEDEDDSDDGDDDGYDDDE
jgi:hypothetical protein